MDIHAVSFRDGIRNELDNGIEKLGEILLVHIVGMDMHILDLCKLSLSFSVASSLASLFHTAHAHHMGDSLLLDKLFVLPWHEAAEIEVVDYEVGVKNDGGRFLPKPKLNHYNYTF